MPPKRKKDKKKTKQGKEGLSTTLLLFFPLNTNLFQFHARRFLWIKQLGCFTTHTIRQLVISTVSRQGIYLYPAWLIFVSPVYILKTPRTQMQRGACGQVDIGSNKDDFPGGCCGQPPPTKLPYTYEGVYFTKTSELGHYNHACNRPPGFGRARLRHFDQVFPPIDPSKAKIMALDRYNFVTFLRCHFRGEQPRWDGGPYKYGKMSTPPVVKPINNTDDCSGSDVDFNSTVPKGSSITELTSSASGGNRKL
ncbi:hypothetical protein DM02DRAFT_674054 [Periconia macrospinosa]|uniref:Uncharacterized protein n=1 Tax=Periconia macrospinosa TaxID=97972 RepID=A0A2V1DIQ7_9PLEO|nr:hypothetical protein DM02DRAFT_674054 [Periconia macrospinosa]